MQTFQQYRNPEKHEQFSPSERKLPVPKLERFWQAFLDFWHSASKEPQVRKRTDRFGNVYWRVYDPVHDCTINLDDEQKVMVWLDEKHYRKSRPNLWNVG